MNLSRAIRLLMADGEVRTPSQVAASLWLDLEKCERAAEQEVKKYKKPITDGFERARMGRLRLVQREMAQLAHREHLVRVTRGYQSGPTDDGPDCVKKDGEGRIIVNEYKLNGIRRQSQSMLVSATDPKAALKTLMKRWSRDELLALLQEMVR